MAFKFPLMEKYINQQFSLPDIAKELELPSVSAIQKRLILFNIKRRSISDSRKLPKSRLKMQNSYIKHYGVRHNFCKESTNRKKWEAKLLKKEGIINVFQRKSVIKKIKETLYRKYGVEKVSELPRLGRLSFSFWHKYILEYLLNIGYTPKKELLLFSKNKKYYRSYDIFIEPYKIIEVNGDFWHANPLKYKADDKILHGTSSYKTAKEIWDYDRKKINMAKKQGYKVLVLWRSDIKEHWEDTQLKIMVFLKG
jgi:hypothetical protein